MKTTHTLKSALKAQMYDRYRLYVNFFLPVTKRCSSFDYCLLFLAHQRDMNVRKWN
ncbi:MAG: hypothetical protein ACUVR3_05790 [Candidatus Roseilinea sp.]|uniref:hypothetical protein n=1 Tax=Candidatus Roseilinea sp. TaxID=2838777 RepID=UPI00404A33BB